MINKKIILGLTVVVIGIILVLTASSDRDNETTEEISPSLSLSPSPSIQPTPFVTDSLLPSTTSDPVNIGDPLLGQLPPAECVLSGSIEYLLPNLYESKEAFINYINIDSVARHIIWSITPDDDVAIGPNLFAGLQIPDGEARVSINFDGEPKSKDYTLSAKVNYGVIVNRNLVILESECTGETLVKISF